MSEDKNPPFLQGAANLRLAANMSACGVGSTPAAAGPSRGHLATAARAIDAQSRREPPPHTCEQRLKLSFYFDGTGNNRDADMATFEHSNVAPMFMAAPQDSDPEGIYSFYIPGLGTYFPDIHDKGEDLGKAMGRRGEDRLQWALKKLQERRAAAKNLTGIDIALFGFSRGAALARAFANRIQALCVRSAKRTGWVLKGTSIAVDIYFLGIWDTVASVGLVKSVNNQSAFGLLAGVGLGDKLDPAHRMYERHVNAIAYGRPGADPSPSTLWAWADGHQEWGGEMSIPPVVSKGVHMMAGHEIRNSFPVDTVVQGRTRSSAFEGEEFVYPGAHSDVGGGYRPGEGGRAAKKGQQLSLIPLRAMYDRARSAGVPLQDLMNPRTFAARRLDFAMAVPSDPPENQAAAREYAELYRLWNRYMDYCGRGARPLGQWFLTHMKAFYAWRFWNIRRNGVDRSTHQPTQDERAVRPTEEASKREQADLERRIAAEESSAPVQQARKETAAARIRLQTAQQRLVMSEQSSAGWMAPLTPEQAQQAALARARQIAKAKAEVDAAQRGLASAEQAQWAAEDPSLRLQAQKATLPSQGTLGRNWREYDERLYADAKLLADAKAFRRYLRPHYLGLVEAWEDEFVHNRGLINADVMRFFETYVHDSLADFALDATLPSDPRVVYVGGDEVAQFAMNARPMQAQDAKAA